MRTRGPAVCDWIERNCVLGEGDFFGEPFLLRDWQRSIIGRLYAVNDVGSRRYRRALIGLPKNNGKTPIAAAIAAYELLGGLTKSPIIPVGAASFDQADLVFGDLKVMCRESPTLSQVTEVYDTEILVKGGVGRAYRVAAARGTNDGARPSCFIADELHEWNDPAKAGAHLVLANGTTKRANSLQLNITTAGSDLDTLLGRMYLHGRKVQAGELDDPTFLFIWYAAADTYDLDDDTELRRAIRECNPAADDFLNVEDVASRFRQIPRFEAERYFLNRWTRADECWLPAGAWSSCRGDVTIPEGSGVYIGIDVALYHDSTAVVVVHPRDDGKYAVKSKVWTPPASGTGIDMADIKQYIRELPYKILGGPYDPRFFDQPARDLQDEGIPMEEWPQTHERMVPACGLAWDLIVQGNLVHDGDSTLEDHVLSAAQRPGDRGWSLSKGKSKRKIDACIAMVMALYAAAQPDMSLQPFGGFV